VVGAALYLVAVALIGSGLAWLLRSTARALTALVGLIVVAPALATLLPSSIGERIAPFLPARRRRARARSSAAALGCDAWRATITAGRAFTRRSCE
jgi:hypothetical protein